jgi:hypothetical protein
MGTFVIFIYSNAGDFETFFTTVGSTGAMLGAGSHIVKLEITQSNLNVVSFTIDTWVPSSTVPETTPGVPIADTTTVPAGVDTTTVPAGEDDTTSAPSKNTKTTKEPTQVQKLFFPCSALQ